MAEPISILLFKTEQKNDKYRSAAPAQCITKFCPLLDIQWINTSELASTLVNDPIDWLVVSSKQAVIAINQSLQSLDEQKAILAKTKLAQCTMFAVGSSAKKRTTFDVREYTCADNATALLNVMQKAAAQSTKRLDIFYPCSEQRSSLIPAAFATSEHYFFQLVVYRPIPVPMSDTLLQDSTNTWWVLFSSATIDALHHCIAVIPSSVKIACLGQTSAQHFFQVFGVTADVVAESPNAKDLYKAIQM